jgi:hypothetical protein
MWCTLALLRSVSRASKGILRRVLRPGTPWGFAKYGLPYDLSEEASVCHCSFRDSNLRSRKPPSLRGGEVWAGLDSNQRRRKASRFTVCPVWPLRYLPVMKVFAVRRSQFSVCGSAPPRTARAANFASCVYRTPPYALQAVFGGRY